MTLSKRGDYVVRSALCLARTYAGGDWRKIREVVAEMNVPQTFASQILADLVRAGLATSRAGKGGGYRLVRPPGEITLLEIVEAGEGPLRSERCALGEGPCRWEKVCPLHETWGAATAALRDTLSHTSLLALVERDEALERGRYTPPADSHRHGTVTTAVADWVQVELSAATISRQLLHAEPWLAAAIKEGYRDAEALRAKIDPTSLPWATSSMPIIAVGASDPPAPGDRRLTWEAGGSRGPASRFEGTLSIKEIDPDRSELRVEGRFRPPQAVADGDPELADRLAQVTLRSALRSVAHTLERTARRRPDRKR